MRNPSLCKVEQKTELFIQSGSVSLRKTMIFQIIEWNKKNNYEFDNLEVYSQYLKKKL